MLKLSDLQLTQYLKRIGINQPVRADLVSLNRLMFAHTSHIPFENIDVLLDKPISIDTADIFNKLVTLNRGGYCFEHNNLFALVLASLGFEFVSVGARVRLAFRDRNIVPERTHLLNLVKINRTYYLVDVGVGIASLTEAIVMQPDIEQQTTHDKRRIEFVNNKFYHQVWAGDHWQDVYEFKADYFEPADQKVANFYTSNHPSSSFTSTLKLAITLADGKRATMFNSTFKIRDQNGELENQVIKTKAELDDKLQRVFAIKLSKRELQLLFDRLQTDN